MSTQRKIGATLLAIALLGAAGDNHTFLPTITTDARGIGEFKLSAWQRGHYKIDQWLCVVFPAGDQDHVLYQAWSDGSTDAQVSPEYGCYFNGRTIFVHGKPRHSYVVMVTAYE